MRVRLKLDRLHDLIARGNLSQNHWAIKIGMSRGHWSEIVNGKHIHPSPKTRERMVEVFGVSFDDLFEIEADAQSGSDPSFQAAISDRYLIDEEIGQGGMGTVYLARDVKLGRQVAIKVVSPEVVSGIGMQQFLKEARYTARLQHQNILGLYDAGEAAGHPYYVMPYIKGGSLRQLLERRGRLPLNEALRVARGVANALDYAHRNHVLHCDVKPENILVTEDHVYVADFGISRAIHAEVSEWGRREGIDSSAGTPAYVSPEQASGERNLDARADVYSFACVMFELLTGRAPFTGRTTMEIVAQRFTSQIPDMRTLAPELPAAIVMSVERAMVLTAAQRTESITRFLDDMERAIQEVGPLTRAARRAAFTVDAAWRWVTGRRAGRSRRLLKGGWGETTLHDVRQAVRSLRRVPAFAVMAILTLAIGIGANTAIFTVVNAVLLQPLPYDRPEELALIWQRDLEGDADGKGTVAPANYMSWLERNNTFSDIAAFNIWFPTLSGEGQPERLVGSVVTPNFFGLLGVAPFLGNGFTPDHVIPGNNRVVVLSYGLWQRRFGGDPNVVGRTVTVNGDQHTVLGVMPESYRHPEPSRLTRNPRTSASQPVVQIWGPVSWADPMSGHNQYLVTLGRMRPGIDVSTADADLAAIARQLEVEWPEYNTESGVRVISLHEELFGDVRRALLMLLGAAGFVLLIVCANVANLVLARSHGRRKEFAIRTALGAGRQRLARQLVAESVLLTVAGGTVGLVGVQVAMSFLRAIQTHYTSSVADVRVDGSVVLFMMVLALVTGVLFGVLPVLQSSRTDLRTTLTEESASAGVTGRTRRLRSGLVVAEVLLATVLAVGAGLMTRSFTTLISVPTGFETTRLLTFGLTLPRAGYDNPERIQAFHAQLAPRLSGLPGVQRFALVSDLPFTSENRFRMANPVDNPQPAGREPFVEYRSVGSGYFQTMGMDLVAGRDFRPMEGQAGDLPVLINRSMAARFWPNEDPLGRRFRTNPTPAAAVVIGVVSDILDDGFDGEFEPRMYQPFDTRPQRFTAVVLRSTVDPTTLVTAVQNEIAALDPQVLASGFVSMDEMASESVADERIALTLAGVFSVLAVVLAGVGIYGVMSYSVGERQREIGVRSALGAQRADVMKLVLGQSGRLTAMGTLGGLALALPLARMLSAFLFEVRWTDPIALGVAPIVLAAVALVASYVPAARATRISPVEALRSER